MGAPGVLAGDHPVRVLRHKNHANLVFTPSTRQAFADELSGLATGKGSVQLPYADPLPEALLTRMIEHRIKEFEVEGVRWM